MGYTQAGWVGFTENNEENEGKKVNPPMHAGYASASSTLPNIENKGSYEKTLDKVGSTLILRGGDKKEISRAQIGTKQEVQMRKEYEAKKSYTNSRRQANTDFLESRKMTGEAVKPINIE